MTFDLTDKTIERSLTHLKRKKDLLKAHRTKAESLMLRREWINHQNKKNYQLEYDKIVSAINSGRVGGWDKDMLKKKAENLKQLGAKDIISIADMV